MLQFQEKLLHFSKRLLKVLEHTILFVRTLFPDLRFIPGGRHVRERLPHLRLRLRPLRAHPGHHLLPKAAAGLQPTSFRREPRPG